LPAKRKTWTLPTSTANRQQVKRAAFAPKEAQGEGYAFVADAASSGTKSAERF